MGAHRERPVEIVRCSNDPGQVLVSDVPRPGRRRLLIGARSFEVQYSLGGFLAGYSANTRDAYQQDPHTFVGWCHFGHIHAFEVRSASQ
jgi:hypothetical protein